MLAGLRDCGPIKNVGTLTEELVEEIIGVGRVVGSVHIIPRNRD